MGVQDRDWYREHHRTQAGYANEVRNGYRFPLQIAIGVALGIIAAAAVIWGYQEWRLRVAAEQLKQTLQAQAAALRAEQVRSEEAAYRARQAAIQQAAKQQRATEAAKRAVFDERERKEQAWDRFYQKPRHCDETTGGSWTVDCANQFIRAKRAFEEKYAAGGIR